MKVLTLTQPWATLVAIGAKRYETRSWSTAYRGPLAIHAAKGLHGMDDRQFQRVCNTPPFWDVLQHTEYSAGMVLSQLLPRAAIIAVCDLVACTRTDEVITAISDQEWAFGDYSPGRFAWELRNVRRLPEPIPARGALSLWTFDHPALDALATVPDTSMA